MRTQFWYALHSLKVLVVSTSLCCRSGGGCQIASRQPRHYLITTAAASNARCPEHCQISSAPLKWLTPATPHKAGVQGLYPNAVCASEVEHVRTSPTVSARVIGMNNGHGLEGVIHVFLDAAVSPGWYRSIAVCTHTPQRLDLWPCSQNQPLCMSGFNPTAVPALCPSSVSDGRFACIHPISSRLSRESHDAAVAIASQLPLPWSCCCCSCRRGGGRWHWVEWGLISECGACAQSPTHIKQCKNNVPDPTGCKREGLLDLVYGDQRKR